MNASVGIVRIDGDRIWLLNGFWMPADPAEQRWQIDILRFVFVTLLGALVCEYGHVSVFLLR